MALLITGANGHVGRTLTRLAAKRGLAVVAQYRSGMDEELAAELGDAVRWVRCDLSDTFAVAALTAECAIEGCVHTAAVPNDRVARPDPWGTVQANVVATGALLELARRQRWRRLVYVSTGSVFQAEADFERPILEDHTPFARSTYGATKLAGEVLVGMYRHEYGLSASTVRISFVYGPPLVPRERDLPRGPVVSLLREAVLGIPIREPSGGDFQASFTHVDDVAEGLLAAYLAPTLNHSVYHLGHGRNWTAREVAEAIRLAVPGAVVEIGPGTMPWTTFNTMRGALGGERLAQDAGFTAALPLDKGVAAFAGWMRGHPERIGA